MSGPQWSGFPGWTSQARCYRPTPVTKSLQTKSQGPVERVPGGGEAVVAADWHTWCWTVIAEQSHVSVNALVSASSGPDLHNERRIENTDIRGYTYHPVSTLHLQIYYINPPFYLLLACRPAALTGSSVSGLHLQHCAEKLLWGLCEEADLCIGMKAIQVGRLRRYGLVNVLKQKKNKTNRQTNCCIGMNLTRKYSCFWNVNIRISPKVWSFIKTFTKSSIEGLRGCFWW